ncbi:MAG: hypothetical protein JNK05_08345 [Myxococcales bacterium]|nr:hypothetical protein [Myxococcales bacterium]
MSDGYDPLAALFDLSTDDPATWRERLQLLRTPYADRAAIRPAYVNDLRFGGGANVDVLESQQQDPRLAFLEEWNNKIRHRKLWDFARCDPAYDASAIDAANAVFARQSVRVPASVTELATRRHAHALVMYWQPTNNFLVLPAKWKVQRGPDDWKILRIINENQGCCYWFVAWRSGALNSTQLDPPVFVGDYVDSALDEVADFFTITECTANRWSEFLLDYAVEGSRWYDENPRYRKDTSVYDRSRDS